MPRISKVRWPAMGLDYGFLFDLQTPMDVEEWFFNVRMPRSKVEYSDALRTMSAGCDAAHAREGGLILTVAEHREISISDALLDVNDAVLNGIRNVMATFGRVFINGNGGYFGPSDVLDGGFEITDTREIDVWALPEERASISKWPGGKHYYARIGSAEVVVDGKEKWDTYSEAEEAAKKFTVSKRR